MSNVEPVDSRQYQWKRFKWTQGGNSLVGLWDEEMLREWGNVPASLTGVLTLGRSEPVGIWRSIVMAMTPEGRLKKQVKKLLNDKGAWSYMPVQNGMGVVGIPDFVCCYKGFLVGIETKAPLKNPTSAAQRWKKATPNQQNRIMEIREAGGIAEVVDTIEQVEEMLRVIDVRAALIQKVHTRGGLFDA